MLLNSGLSRFSELFGGLTVCVGNSSEEGSEIKSVQRTPSPILCISQRQSADDISNFNSILRGGKHVDVANMRTLPMLHIIGTWSILQRTLPYIISLRQRRIIKETRKTHHRSLRLNIFKLSGLLIPLFPAIHSITASFPNLCQRLPSWRRGTIPFKLLDHVLIFQCHLPRYTPI